MKILQKIGVNIYIYILLIFPLFANAQLINNGNFEAHSTIPTDISQLGYCNNWTNGGSLLSAPDYYHTLCPTANFCPITPLNVKVPTNILGTQSDHSLLSAYVGIITYDYALRDYRDYIQTPTVDATLHTPKPLTPGSDYAVTFQYSNADNAYFASDIGVMLTAGAINLAAASPYWPGTYPYPYFRTDKPSVPTPSNYKTDWYTFSETFHLGCETNIDHLAIGNFQQHDTLYTGSTDYNVTQVIPGAIPTGSCTNNIAYYYIDDVTIVELNKMPVPDPTTGFVDGAVINLCHPGIDIITLGLTGTLGTVQWYLNHVPIPGPAGTGFSLSVTTPGEYTVDVTSTNCPSLVHTYHCTITSPTSPDVDGIFTDCQSPLNYTITNPISGYTYSWTLSDGSGLLSTGTGSTFNYSFTIRTAPYTLNVRATDGTGCFHDTSYTVYPCCTPNGATYNILTNGTASALEALYGPTIGGWPSGPSNALNINGVFTVDQDITFLNCRIYFEPFSRIEIVGGHTAHFLYSQLFACNNVMWTGIYTGIDATNTGTCDIQHCILEDAKDGILVRDGSYLNAFSDTFNRNWNHIRILPTSSTTARESIIKCDFRVEDLSPVCFAYYPPTPNLLFPYVGDYSRSGVDLKGNRIAQIGIATTTTDINKFFRSRYGVISSDCGLSCFNNYFSGMLSDRWFPVSGTGIFASNTFTGVGTPPFLTPLLVGNSTAGSNLFDNSKLAVHAEGLGMNVIISRNNVSNCTSGFEVFNCRGTTLSPTTVTTDYNAIDNFKQNGIWFHDCLPANLECNYNVPIHAIEDVSLLTTGINLEQSTLVSCPNKEIAYNVIHAAKLGIEIFNHPNLVKVHDNEVDNRLITNTYRCTGIAAVNASYFQIYCNGVYGISGDENTLNKFGISAGGGGFNQVYCNVMDYTGVGLNTSNSSMTNGIYGNDFRHMFNAINTFGIITPGNQRFPGAITTKQNGNQFNGPFTDPLHYKIVNSTAWTYFYQTTPPPAYWVYDCHPSHPLLGTVFSSLAPYSCACTAPAAPPIHLFARALNSDSSLLVDQLDVATGNKEYGSDKDELWLYNDQKQLYSSLQQDSGTGIAELDSFKTANLNSGIGIQDSFNYYMAEQKEEQFAAKNKSLLAGNIIDSLEGEINKELMYKLHSWEYNQLDTNKIISIANLCPYIYGNAVYRARAMLHVLRGYSNYEWLDESACDAKKPSSAARRAQIKRQAQAPPLDTSLFAIYPNPASNTLTVSLFGNAQQWASLPDNGLIQITNVLGNVVKATAIDPRIGLFELNIADLVSGNYILTLIINSNQRYHGKFAKN